MKASTRGSRDNSMRESPLLPTKSCWLHQREMKANSGDETRSGQLRQSQVSSKQRHRRMARQTTKQRVQQRVCAHFNITSTSPLLRTKP
jgi:hypothetical protein